jgi:hypothetical protein
MKNPALSSAMVRAEQATNWGGLWLRIDGPDGVLTIDNMSDRALRGTTDWTQADIVLDVPDQATELHFGTLLDGAGAFDITRPRLEEVSEAVPATARSLPLPDEPQALDFGIAS